MLLLWKYEKYRLMQRWSEIFALKAAKVIENHIKNVVRGENRGSKGISIVCSFVCFDFNIGTFLTLQKNKMMRKVRSIKSDDTEEWYKEADFKFKMLRGGGGGLNWVSLWQTREVLKNKSCVA